MNFKQFYLGCLAHASYYLGSDAEAAIIDPQRDVEQYLAEAAANGQKIKYVIETHSHADFVSGHLELARKTGAEIVYGRRAETKFPAVKVGDGDYLRVGKIKLKFLETPGHTPEGICIIAEDAADVQAPLKVFTGDTLFIGDVGRPDLSGSQSFTPQQMAEMLFDSLHDKILSLPDDAEIYPAHGAGSLCGKSLSKEIWSTLGAQKKSNYALQPMAKAEFVKLITADQREVPAYFPHSASTNLAGAGALEDLPRPRALSAEEMREFGGVILDVRSAAEFGAGHFPRSLNIGLGGQFAAWAGSLIGVETPIVIAAESENQVDEASMRLARVGIEMVEGFILIEDQKADSAEIEQISVGELDKILSENADLQLIDVRRESEYKESHAPKAVNLTLANLSELTDRLDKNKPIYVICQGGYRSSAGTSILERAGFREIYNVAGGTEAWIKAGLKTESLPAEARK